MNHTTNPQDERERLAKNLRDARRRVQSTLVANADRLSTPFTDDPGKNPWDTFVRPAMRELKSAVDAALAVTEPAYDRTVWETYRRDAGCACTSPDPSTCAVSHRPGPWLCVCHRLSSELTEQERTTLFAEQPAVSPSAVVSADRATLLREAATRLWHQTSGLTEYGRGARWAIGELRRLANEAEFAATPCAPVVPCEDGGEPCDVHERMLGHYEDSHELCPPDCGATGGPSRVAAEEQPAETQAPDLAAALDGLHTLIATSSRDWQTYRVDAWIWAVLCGWDCEQAEHDETCTHGALEETAAMHGWGADTVAKARRYRAAVRAVVEAQQPDTQTREARVGRCSAVMLRVHHAPHGWEPQPGMDPVHCPGYPQPGKES